MTLDQLTRLAAHVTDTSTPIYAFTLDELTAFASLVAAAERESCAKMFDGKVWTYDYREIAAAIRARDDA